MANLQERDKYLVVSPWGRLDRLFDEWMRVLPMPRLPSGQAPGEEIIRVDEYRDDDTQVLRAELPGIDPDKDVEISVHDGLLHIKGERSEHEEETKKTFYRSEFRYGMFERTVPLPAGATEKDVRATYKDGMLEVRIPMKTAETEAAKVPVQRLG